MANHADLTGAELHENKGVAAATDDFVATAASSATVWKKITTDNIDTTDIFGLNTIVVTCEIPDISTASKTWVVMPFAVSVTTIYTVIDAAITAADATLTARNHSGGSMGTITITQSGSAAGDVDSLTPVSNNTFAAGEHFTIETDGGSTTTSKAIVTLVLTRTA